MTASKIILIITATTTALMAGLFYSWSCSVTPGLARLSDAEYIRSFQAMNRAILNPVFLIAFMGTAFLLPLSTFMQYSQPISVRFWLLLAATAAYLVGVMGVTMFGNVPMNDALDAFNTQSATAQELATQRINFEQPWNYLNNIRTIAAIISIVLVIVACLAPERSKA